MLFKPLTLADIKKIVDLQLDLLRARLADRHIELVLSDAAKEHVAREGYDPVHGARPLKRFLQRAVETTLSRKLIAGEVPDHSRVTVDFKKSELVFETKPWNHRSLAGRSESAAAGLRHSRGPGSTTWLDKVNRWHPELPGQMAREMLDYRPGHHELQCWADSGRSPAQGTRFAQAPFASGPFA